MGQYGPKTWQSCQTLQLRRHISDKCRLPRLKLQLPHSLSQDSPRKSYLIVNHPLEKEAEKAYFTVVLAEFLLTEVSAKMPYQLIKNIMKGDKLYAYAFQSAAKPHLGGR